MSLGGLITGWLALVGAVPSASAPETLFVIVGVVIPPLQTVCRALFRSTEMTDPLHGRAIKFVFLHGVNRDAAVSDAVREDGGARRRLDDHRR